MHLSASFALLVTAVVLFLLSSSANARLTRVKRQATISASCINPTGNDCNWYSNCLEASIHCQGTQDDYAIAFGKTYCDLLNSNYNKFSSQGKQWVDAVRLCLQLKLVPLLNATSPCNVIKSTAFASHLPCYLAPGGGALGLCDLPVGDIKLIKNTLIRALGTAFWETVIGVLKVFKLKLEFADYFYKTLMKEISTHI